MLQHFFIALCCYGAIGFLSALIKSRSSARHVLLRSVRLYDGGELDSLLPSRAADSFIKWCFFIWSRNRLPFLCNVGILSFIRRSDCVIYLGFCCCLQMKFPLTGQERFDLIKFWWIRPAVGRTLHYLLLLFIDEEGEEMHSRQFFFPSLSEVYRNLQHSKA